MSSLYDRESTGKWFGTKYERAYNQGRLRSTKLRKENLSILNKVFKRHDIKMFLMYGTLLGAVRDGDLIINDRDDDVGILLKDKEKFTDEVMSELIDLNFELVRISNHGTDVRRKEFAGEKTNGHNHSITLGRNEMSIDICLFSEYSENQYMYYLPTILLDKRYLDNLEVLTLDGEPYNIPTDSKYLLEGIYGSDWQTPQSNKWCTSCNVKWRR